MVRVGFTIIGGKTNWMGGINYLKNLLFAINHLADQQIQPVLFVGKKVDKKLLKEFEGLAIIIQATVFDRFSFHWFVDFILRDIFKVNPIVNTLVKRNDIKVFSHSFIYGRDLKCISINWIPDFQHLHLPHMFSRLNLLVRDFRLHAMAKYSDRIIVSSYDAYNDYKKFAPEYTGKASVVHFVSQTNGFELKPISYLESKYDLKFRFFFLPNQFWAHKNHMVAFEAIRLLKDNYPDIQLICSGVLMDNRNSQYIDSLIAFVKKNGLQANIHFLGLIPYDDVKLLMYYSIAVVNPSYFEGWSSSVEESKSMGKAMLLSDIPVHYEQATGRADFFKYNDAHELSLIMMKYWNERNLKNSSLPPNDLSDRTKKFALEYQAVILDCVK